AMKFVQLVNTHKPSLIVIDACSLEAADFKEDLEKKVLVDHPHIRVELMDPELARIYTHSARAELEFREESKLIRLAISLGRRALDPIAEICGVFSGIAASGINETELLGS